MMRGIMKEGYGSRRRWMNVYVVMVIVCLVCGCGILGLMGLHRLKERRILNHLIKQKDDQILSLHHLLQKEREHMQEVKRKTEEMKIKIYSLRSQKTELNSRVLQMQSTISSLKDEQSAIELAYQEKQNEAKLLREQYMEIKDQNHHVEALTEVLHQKEAEIEVLKHRLQLHGAMVGSVSTDERVILPVNITAKANMLANETASGENNGGDMHDAEHGSETNDGEEADADRGKETNEYESEKNSGKEEQKPRDGKEFATMGDGFSRRISNSQRRENQDLEVDNKSLVKLEMQENSHSGHYRFRGKQGYPKRVKGKRWKPNAKQTEEKRSWQSNGDLNIVESTEEIGGKDEFHNSNTGMSVQNEPVSKDAAQGEEMLNDAEENTEDSSLKVGKFDRFNQSEKGWEATLKDSSSESSHISLDGQSKEQEIAIREHAENDDNGQHNNRLGRKEAAERKEGAGGIQMEHFEGSAMGEESED